MRNRSTKDLGLIRMLETGNRMKNTNLTLDRPSIEIMEEYRVRTNYRSASGFVREAIKRYALELSFSFAIHSSALMAWEPRIMAPIPKTRFDSAG
jgi:hypothetical protein